MPKRLYIPEWDGIYPPKKKLDSANKTNTVQNTRAVKKKKGIESLIEERSMLEEKCDTFHKCKQEESCKSCEIFKKIKDIDTKIEEKEKKFIKKEEKERALYYVSKISQEEGVKPYIYKSTEKYMKFQKFKICKYCGKKYLNELFLKKHIDNTHFLPIDLHGFYLKEAIIYVESKLEECIDRGVGGLRLIHGYHHGTILREYFRSEKFKIDMTHVGLIIGIYNIKDLGYTLIRVNMEKLKKSKYRLS